MLEIVTKGFKSAKDLITGTTTLTEDNIQEAMQHIRTSLLEADVALEVVRTFLHRVKTRAIGEVVQLHTHKDKKRIKTTPHDHFVMICQQELEKLMGPVEEAPIIYKRPITIIMMVGLQGTGKTTTCGKIAAYLLQQKRKPLLVAADMYRPAAIEQLKVLGNKLGVPVFAKDNSTPQHICLEALACAKSTQRDVVIFDTAGRLAIDQALMQELVDIQTQTKPHYVFLVCDAMAGQDTVRTAQAFDKVLDISGFIMTKMDGDARGGAALSIKEITGKPIKFIGMGEGLDKLESFRPEGLASRILGMGDIVGLMRDFEHVVDEKQAERDAKKLLRGQFTFDDFLSQLKMMKKMGSVKDIYDKIPLLGDKKPPGNAAVDDKLLISMTAMIQSMTKPERHSPQLLDESRIKRVAKGSGTEPQQVKELIGRFNMMQQMMGNLSRMGKPKDLMNMFAPSKHVSNASANRGLEQMLGKMMADPTALQHPGLSPGPYAQQAADVSHRLIDPRQKQKQKDKRKAEKQARKKSRR